MLIKWINSIRLLALVLILIYHFFPDKIPGGFLGVDIFFTISGFLMTGLFLENIKKDRKFSISNFLKKRFIRIVMPLIFSIIIILPFTLLIGTDFRVDIDKQIFSVLGFVTNYYEILNKGNYENQFFPHLFIHTWTLSIEMHFYLFWGVILFLHAKINNFKLIKISLLCISIAILVASIYMLQKNIDYDNKSFLYFFDLTHCFSLFIGNALACLIEIKKPILEGINKNTILMLLLINISILCYFSLTLDFNSKNTFTYGLISTSFITCSLIIFTRILNEYSTIEELMIIRYLNKISYLIYLFHWTFFIIFKQVVGNEILVVIYTMAITLFFSHIYYWYIEKFFIKIINEFSNNYFITLRRICLTTLLFIPLLGCSIKIIKNTPRVSRLEEELWFSNIEQDIDSLNEIKEEVIKIEKQKNEIKEKNTEKEIKEKVVDTGITIIGDSITLGARKYLLENIKNSTVDAAGSRSMQAALEVFRNQKRTNKLRTYVVLCIGTNALKGDDKILMKLIDELPKGHALILMTVFDGRANEKWNSSKLTAFYRTLPEKYSFITIADWNKIASQNLEIYGRGDKVHFAGNQLGNKLYAKCIMDAIKEARLKKKK